MRKLIFGGTLVALAASLQAGGIIVVGSEAGQVAVMDKSWLSRAVLTLRPFGNPGALYVAAGLDYDGDGKEDFVVGSGPGQETEVKIFNLGGGLLGSFTPYGGFQGGVRVAVGDVNNDGVADIITGAGAGAGAAGGHVKVFDGESLQPLGEFWAYDTSFLGGVYVAAGDLNGDGFAEIITGAGPGGGPHVKVFNGETLQEHASFPAYGTEFNGGVRVAVGDVNGDGSPEILTGAGPGAGPHVKVFSGNASLQQPPLLLHSFFAFDPRFQGGVYVASGSVVVTPGGSSGAIATIRIFEEDGSVQWLMPFPSYTGGMTVATSAGLMSKTPARPRIPGSK